MTYPEENQNGYDVLVSYESWNGVWPGLTKTIKMISPTGVKEGYSINAGGIVKMDEEIRGTIRSFATKMPQFYFSAFP